jgi:hypothetical protein
MCIIGVYRFRFRIYQPFLPLITSVFQGAENKSVPWTVLVSDYLSRTFHLSPAKLDACHRPSAGLGNLVSDPNATRSRPNVTDHLLPHMSYRFSQLLVSRGWNATSGRLDWTTDGFAHFGKSRGAHVTKAYPHLSTLGPEAEDDEAVQSSFASTAMHLSSGVKCRDLRIGQLINHDRYH